LVPPLTLTQPFAHTASTVTLRWLPSFRMGLTTTSIGRVLARLVAALLVLTLATAQEASGLVLGFDGKPVAGAVVVARAQSPEWHKQLLTDGNGRFAIAAAGPLSQV
jgi:hypothetical protein